MCDHAFFALLNSGVLSQRYGLGRLEKMPGHFHSLNVIWVCKEVLEGLQIVCLEQAVDRRSVIKIMAAIDIPDVRGGPRWGVGFIGRIPLNVRCLDLESDQNFQRILPLGLQKAPHRGKRMKGGDAGP